MTDTFRKEYRPLREENQNLIRSIKEAAEVMEGLMRSVNSREMSLALTNLEQCTMWSTKAIVLADERKGDEL
jgi:hypothetical protein